MQRFYVLVLLSTLTIASTTLILTQQAVAQGPALSGGCATALQRTSRLTNRNGMMQCLKDHENGSFRRPVKHACRPSRMKPCAQDAMTLCSTVEQGNKTRDGALSARSTTQNSSAGCKSAAQ